MTLGSYKLLDEVGWKLLLELQVDGRLSYAELGRRVGLSLPAVAERVRRMEEAGLITGYHAHIDLPQVGLPLTAFIRIMTTSDRYPTITTLVKKLPAVLECHHLTGTDSFIVKVVAASIPDLERLITQLSAFGQTATSIVLSSPVTRRIIGPDQAGQAS